MRFANLLGQKAVHKLTNEDMGKIINVSRRTFEQKIRSGRFTPEECKAFCVFFGKSFDFLFAEEPRSAKPSVPILLSRRRVND